MNSSDPFGPHPAPGGFLVTVGLLLATFALYFLYDSVRDTDIQIVRYWVMVGTGAALWLIGCGLLARSWFLPFVAGLLLGLLLLPGLFVLWLSGRNRTRFATAPPSAGPTSAATARERRRQEPRNMKPLY